MTPKGVSDTAYDYLLLHLYQCSALDVISLPIALNDNSKMQSKFHCHLMYTACCDWEI